MTTETRPYSRLHPLRWPIADDKGNQLTTIKVCTIPLSTSSKIKAEHKGDDDAIRIANNEAYLRHMTGLTDAEVMRLCMPDYNSLIAIVLSLSNKTTGLLRNEDGEETDSDSFPLLVPVSDPFKGTVTQIEIRPPTVQMTRLVQEFSGEVRERKLAALATGLDETVFDQLHMPDWNQLTEVLSDFLSEDAGFFPQKTSST
ncbi:phage tail assembly protein [Bacillus inaquosorum]|uniref:phage tail assembly protein n=2 Tax=Bacillus inaquosorum TaxID=483913 RepID=UPI003D0094C5